MNLVRSHITIRDHVWSLQHDPGATAEKPTVVFLHGFLGSGDVFKPLLARMAGSINPILVDLPGHGATIFPNDPKHFQLPQQLVDLKTLLAGVAPPRFFLYGYSMGGRLALRYALLHEEQIDGLILESTSHGISGLGDARKRVAEDADRSAEILNDYQAFLTKWNRMPMFAGGTPQPDEMEAYMAIQRAQNPVGIANSLIGFSAGLMPDVRPRLRQLGMPVLLMAGGYDQAYVQSAGLLASLIPVHEKVVISDAAHRVHLDAPDQVCGNVTSFIKKHHSPP